MTLVCASPPRYCATWYDYSGHEYRHVTAAWLAARLLEQTGKRWRVTVQEHGNGNYSANATEDTA